MVGTGERSPMEDLGNSALISTGSSFTPLTSMLLKEVLTTSSVDESCSIAFRSIFLSIMGLISSIISSSSEVVSSSSKAKLEGSRQGSSPYFLK